MNVGYLQYDAAIDNNACAMYRWNLTNVLAINLKFVLQFSVLQSGGNFPTPKNRAQSLCQILRMVNGYC